MDVNIMAAIISVNMTRNDGNDMPIVPGLPHKPMSMRTAQTMVTTQQHAVMA